MVVIAIGAADGETVALLALQVPHLEGLPSYRCMQLVAADQVNEPVGLALIGQGFYAVGEYESGQAVTVEIFGSVVDTDEVVCVLHTKQFCFKRKMKKRKQPLRRRGAAAKKQRNKRWPGAKANAPTVAVGALCLWRNFFAAAKKGRCGSRLVCFAFFY